MERVRVCCVWQGSWIVAAVASTSRWQQWKEKQGQRKEEVVGGRVRKE